MQNLRKRLLRKPKTGTSLGHLVPAEVSPPHTGFGVKCLPTTTANGYSERDNPPSALASPRQQDTIRKPGAGGMTAEAKAYGNA